VTIPQRVIEEVRDRADIVEVVGEVVRLKKRGKNWVGLCPFHPEKTPSFNVTPEKQMYYCFGCQAGGNVFTFLMEYEKLDFPSAVRGLAERVGVEVPDTAVDQGPDPNAGLYHANRLAAELYHRLLLEGPHAAAARTYLEERGIERETVDAFLLGWAPEEWETLIREAERQGVDRQTLTDAGLASRSERTGGVYDRFRGRLCFPIRSVGGKVVALSGRRLDDAEPKYLNSADSPIFTKGRTLFNLDLARGPIRRSGAVVVVEGNFDVVSLHQAGFRNVVAPLGTAFTAEQARILKRYTATAYLAYDGDPAGERSAFRTADLLLPAGFAVRIVRLALGEDPDSVVRRSGSGAFEERLRESRDVIDAKLDIVRERVDLADVMKKRRAIRRLMSSVERVADPVTRALYTEKLADALDVPRETLLRAPRAAEPRRERGAGRVPADQARFGGRGFRGPGVELPEAQEERYVLLHAVTDERWLRQLVEACRAEFFSVPAYAEFFRVLTELASTDRAELVEEIRASPDPRVQTVLARIEMLRADDDGEFELSERTFQESLRRLHEGALDRGAIASAEPTGDILVDTLRRREQRRRLTRGRAIPGVGEDASRD